ncbi:MAG: hypothetical protein OWQ54_02650 [Sulfolobaceae archaeon]|nr:hypothetical protein [Sulfolobaceae archaeon]
MMSLLLGSKPKSWEYLDDVFADYRNAGVYVNEEGVIEVVKVSDIDEFQEPTSVLLPPSYLEKLRPFYLKLARFVAFPTKRLEVAERLTQFWGWRAYEQFIDWKFVGAWVLYDCENCKSKQKEHLEINENGLSIEEIVRKHLEIYNSS